MIEGLTAVYGVNTQATFQLKNYMELGWFHKAATGAGCFVCSANVPGQAYRVTVIGATDNVELVALAYPKALVKQPSPELVG